MDQAPDLVAPILSVGDEQIACARTISVLPPSNLAEVWPAPLVRRNILERCGIVAGVIERDDLRVPASRRLGRTAVAPPPITRDHHSPHPGVGRRHLSNGLAERHRLGHRIDGNRRIDSAAHEIARGL